MATTRERLEYLRGELRAERISYGELAELQSLAPHIDPADTELLEAAGVPEKPARPRKTRERWVFTPSELKAPDRCNRADEFLAFITSDPPECAQSGVIMTRDGKPTNRFDDGTAGVPPELAALADEEDEYTVPLGTYQNGQERDRGEPADTWCDVLVTPLGFFAGFAGGGK